jgi:hypothetical protein
MVTTLRRPVIKQCPHRDETDAGTLTVVIDGPAPELHEFAAGIDALCGKPVSHEDFTIGVCDLLDAAGIYNAAVTTTWHTGPWDVQVRKEATS